MSRANGNAARRQAKAQLEAQALGCATIVEVPATLPTDAARLPTAADAYSLRQHIVGLYNAGTLTANDMVKMAWFITQAGGIGLEDLAQNPDTVGSNASRVVKKALQMVKIQEDYLMYFDIPQRGKRKNAHGRLRKRGTFRKPLAILPVYEVLSKLFSKVGQGEFMKHVGNPNLLCGNFYEHAIVKAEGADKCFPLRVFADFAQLDNKSNVLNIFMSCLHLQKRIPLASIHGKALCKCGCRGSHSLQPVWDVVAWLLRVCASGVWPRENYHGVRWPASSWRSHVAGEPLFNGLKGVVVEISCDLDEYPKTLGLPDYKSLFGCLKCFKSKRNRNDLAMRSRKRTHRWLLETGSSSLSIHPVNEATVMELKANCTSKKKKAGVTVDKPCANLPGLRVGDRLEPTCGDLVDFWHGDNISDAHPDAWKVLVYSRPRNSLMFINRLFTIPGIQPGVPGLTYSHYLLDRMHVLDLGILLYIIATTVWKLLTSHFFGRFNDDEHDRLDEVLLASTASFYDRANMPVRERLDLTIKVLGPRGRPHLKAKAGPSRRLFPWIIDLLRRQGGAGHLDVAGPLGCEGSSLLECSEALAELYAVLAREPRKMPEEALVHAHGLCSKCAVAWKRSGGNMTMKWHAFAEHLVDQMRFAGNVAWTHNYADESENFSTRRRGTSVSRQVYSKMFLTKWYREFLMAM